MEDRLQLVVKKSYAYPGVFAASLSLNPCALCDCRMKHAEAMFYANIVLSGVYVLRKLNASAEFILAYVTVDYTAQPHLR